MRFEEVLLKNHELDASLVDLDALFSRDITCCVFLQPDLCGNKQEKKNPEKRKQDNDSSVRPWISGASPL